MTILDELPIALRTRRRSAAPQACHSEETLKSKTVDTPESIGLFTPSRGSKKRVRFSDPGLLNEQEIRSKTEDDAISSSTGLTPHIRRTTLKPVSGSKKRRHPGPDGNIDCLDAFDSTIDTMQTGEVTFLPLRQVLDGRVKRRIRRNGLSEEINIISAEKKRKSQQTKEEIAALRAEVASKDAEIRRLSGATKVSDEDEASVEDLKRQVAQARRALKSPESSSHRSEDSTGYDTTHACVDWTPTTARDPFSGDCSDMDILSDSDSEFGENTMAELACSTPTRRSSNIRHSFPTPPSTSPPPLLLTPSRRQVVTPTSNAVGQTSFTNTEGQDDEEELASLHLEVAKLTHTLETYEAMTSRLSDKLMPFAPKDGSAAALIMDSRSPTVKLEAQLNNLLQAFSDSTATLSEMDTSLGELGFPGGDANEIISSLSSALRTVRLELEYLTPGEITLPLTAAGASVLDLLLTRLRELARRSLEDEDTMDEYHDLEVSLRKQLSARVEAMDSLKKEFRTLEKQSRSKDTRLRELEAGVERLKGSVRSYTQDVSELEGLVQRLEGDLDTANKGLREAEEDRQADVEEWEDILKGKDETVAMLEEKLGLALEQTSELKEQLSSLQNQEGQLRAGHEEGLSSMAEQHGATLASRDSKVAGLSSEIDRVNRTLQSAHETIQKLRMGNGSLAGALDSEKARPRRLLMT